MEDDEDDDDDGDDDEDLWEPNLAPGSGALWGPVGASGS